MPKLALIAAVPMACSALGPTSLPSTQAATASSARAPRCVSAHPTPADVASWWKRTGSGPWREIGLNYPGCNQLPPGLRQLFHKKHLVCFVGRHPVF